MNEKKQYRVWKWDNDEKRILWLTESEAAEYRRAGYYVVEV